jgi:hypothetical protein
MTMTTTIVPGQPLKKKRCWAADLTWKERDTKKEGGKETTTSSTGKSGRT